MAESLLALPPVGLYVCIHGLRAVAHHNGKFGLSRSRTGAATC